MKLADLTPQGRTNLGACIGRLFAGDDFALKIDGSVRFLCYRAGEELLPRIPKDRQSAGAKDSGLFLSGDSFASIDDLGGEPLERRWLFAGSIDELHIVLDCQGVDVEVALQTMAKQASLSTALRSLQPKGDGPEDRSQQVGFFEVDCVLAGNIPTENHGAKLAIRPARKDKAMSSSVDQLSAAIRCVELIVTTYSRSSEENGGWNDLDDEILDEAHKAARDVFVDGQMGIQSHEVCGGEVDGRFFSGSQLSAAKQCAETVVAAYRALEQHGELAGRQALNLANEFARKVFTEEQLECFADEACKLNQYGKYRNAERL